MSEPGFKTVLVPDRQPLAGPLGCSLLFHGGLVFAAVVGRGLFSLAVGLLWLLFPQCNAPDPMPLDSIEVSMVSLPKSERNVPDRAARVQRAEGIKEPAPEPPPVRESDLVVKSKVPDPDPGNTTEELRRQQLLQDIERRRMLEQLENAPEGTVDRDATDPNSLSDVVTAGVAAGARGDPEYMRWYAEVQRQIMGRFKPLGGKGNVSAMGRMMVDPESGKILSSTLVTPSNVLAFDSAAERAMQGLGTIPLPPEKYLPLLRDGITFEFVPP